MAHLVGKNVKKVLASGTQVFWDRFVLIYRLVHAGRDERTSALVKLCQVCRVVTLPVTNRTFFLVTAFVTITSDVSCSRLRGEVERVGDSKPAFPTCAQLQTGIISCQAVSPRKHVSESAPRLIKKCHQRTAQKGNWNVVL
jgi:hypothetical protein